MIRIGTRLLPVLAMFMALGVSRPAQAVTCTELNQLWIEKFYFDFKMNEPLKTFHCRSTESAIAKGMYDLATTTFDFKGADQSFSFYNWTVGHIKRTDYVESDKNRPWAIAQAGQNGVMTLFKGFATTDPDWRAASLVHEARHMESSDPSHVNCAAGEGKGQPRCDAQLHDDGTWGKGSGYNYTFTYLWWLRDGAVQTDLDREVAGALMKSMLLSNFNNVTKEQLKRWGD